MSEYQLETLNNTNVNVNLGDDFLGKLYFFPVEESELKAQGIEKQWFLTYHKGDCLLTGHINKDNQWSLCNPQDLTPTHDYYAVDELLSRIFSEDFVAGLNSPTKADSWTRSGEKSKLNLVFNSQESNHSDEADSDSSIKEDKFIEKEANINVAQTPISSLSLEEDEEEIQEADIEEVEQEPENQISEEQRQLLELDLRTIIWEGYKANLLELETQEADEPWLMELDSDSELIKLTSTLDQHTVLAINKNGEIIKHLSLADADFLIDDFVQEKEPNQEWGLNLSKPNNQEKQSQQLEIE